MAGRGENASENRPDATAPNPGDPQADRATVDNVWSAVWRCAGIAGVDPARLTLRELVPMAEAAARQQWDIGSAIMCVVHNTQCLSATNMLAPEDFHPMRQNERVPKYTRSADFIISALAAMYCPPQGDRP